MVDPDPRVEAWIISDLENAQRLMVEFEKAFPKTSGPQNILDRMRNRPLPQSLYPKLFVAENRSQWLMPLIRRGAGEQTRSDDFSVMLGLVFEKTSEVTEPEFLALAQIPEAFTKGRSISYFSKMGVFLRQFEKAGTLNANVAGAARELRGRSDVANRGSFTWPLFRTAQLFAGPDPCWSARLREDLENLPPKVRADWLRAFDSSNGEPTRSSLAALKRLGNEKVEDGLRRWIAMLDGDSGPALSPVGAIVFQHVISICDWLGGRPCDEMFYRIARAPWREVPEAGWIVTYVRALDRRSQDRAFACLEALMMSPATAFEAIRRKYEAHLAAFGATAIADSPVGVDGYPLDRDPDLSAQHTRIDELLRMASAAAAQGPYVHPSVASILGATKEMKEEDQSAALRSWLAHMKRDLPWFPVSPDVKAAHEALEAGILKEFADNPASLHRAAVMRSEWIAAHRREYSYEAMRLWEEWLHGLGRCGGGLVQRTLVKVDELPLESLLKTIRTGWGNTRVLELCEKHVAQHGWTLELVETFREWIRSVGAAASDQTHRARAEWIVWFEEVAPVDLDACWSHRVKQDLRAMAAEEKSAWRGLLDNTTFIITGKPPVKWLKAGEKLFPRVGLEQFRRRFARWFEPFAKGEPVRLTVTGRNILRVLMWYVLIAKDSVVDDALVGFANVQWKTKDTAKRAAQAEMAFSHVLSVRAPDAALPILEQLVASGQAFQGSATHIIYEQICARKNRTPVRAIAPK
jgi:hypothetical protein